MHSEKRQNAIKIHGTHIPDAYFFLVLATASGRGGGPCLARRSHQAHADFEAESCGLYLIGLVMFDARFRFSYDGNVVHVQYSPVKTSSFLRSSRANESREKQKTRSDTARY